MENPIPRDEQGRFKPGNSGGSGRPKGARNKLGEAFCIALYEDFCQHGVAVIEAVRVERPADYLKLVAGLVPRQIDLAPADDDDDEYVKIRKNPSRAFLDKIIADVMRENPTPAPQSQGQAT